MRSFEEDIRAHCYFSLFGNMPPQPAEFAR
jgi:hypothetical protein